MIGFDPEQFEILKNSVKNEVSAFTAVEIDTVVRMNNIVTELVALLDTRPHNSLQLIVNQPNVFNLLSEAKNAISDWPDDKGVLFILDTGERDENDEDDFWTAMNFLREKWGALNCHIVFFLLPRNYKLMLTVGIHFADWVSLKLHIMKSQSDEFNHEKFQSPQLGVSDTSLTPAIAQQTLKALEPQLAKAIKSNIDKSALVRRYYLPMFEATVVLRNLHRAAIIRDKISVEHIPASEFDRWWYLNTELDIELRDFDSAEQHCQKLLESSNLNHNKNYIVASYYNLGVIAKERSNFDTAKKWFLKAISLSKKLKNNGFVAAIYINLGLISKKNHKFDVAEDWCYQALRIFKRLEDERNSATTFVNLGIIAIELRDFDTAEKWHLKALQIYKKLKDYPGMALSYNNLGEIANERHEFVEAENSYHKALRIFEKLGWEYNVAIIYHQLGTLAGVQSYHEKSGKLLIKSYKLFKHLNDIEKQKKAKKNFLITLNSASPKEQSLLRKEWEDAGLGTLPENKI